MCGIAGMVYLSGARPHDAEKRFSESLDSLAHRGPDMRGEYEAQGIWLGHRRLSILDLSAAAGQPMTSRDGRYVICHNGEVYNYRDIAKALDFRELQTHSDTEVILRAFALQGVESFSLLNGMFALAIVDIEERRLWLLRDRLGIKPLYFCLEKHKMVFASEMKAVRALLNRDGKLNISAVNEWLHYGNPLGAHTLYEGIQRLLPGHYMELDLDTLEFQIECYWNVASFAGKRAPVGTPKQCIAKVRALLEQAVVRQLVSDVPLGVFLSGGVDSSAITAFASRHYEGKLASYSASFDYDKGVNELVAAKSLAQRYGTEHHEFHISGGDVADIILKMVEHHDHPFSDAANIPLFKLGSLVADSRKVVLQGDGGDEVFGGYRRYTTLSFLPLLQKAAGLAALVNGFLPNNLTRKRRQRYFNALTACGLAETMGWLLTEEDREQDASVIFAEPFRRCVLLSDPLARYRDCQARVSSSDVVNQMLMVDAMIILPDIFLEKVDRSTMAASIEARVPFLDNDLVNYCFGLPGSWKVKFGRKKWLLKKALDGIVPDFVLFGKKTGFGVPYGHWLRKDLRVLFFDQMSTFDYRHPGILSRRNIEDIYADHVDLRNNRAFLLWKLLNFMIWANHGRVEIDVA